jgi:hypothetical protein
MPATANWVRTAAAQRVELKDAELKDTATA